MSNELVFPGELAPIDPLFADHHCGRFHADSVHCGQIHANPSKEALSSLFLVPPLNRFHPLAVRQCRGGFIFGSGSSQSLPAILYLLLVDADSLADRGRCRSHHGYSRQQGRGDLQHDRRQRLGARGRVRALRPQFSPKGWGGQALCG